MAPPIRASSVCFALRHLTLELYSIWPLFDTIAGANAILAVSMAVAKAGAAQKGVPLYQYFADLAGNKKLPRRQPPRHAGVHDRSHWRPFIQGGLSNFFTVMNRMIGPEVSLEISYRLAPAAAAASAGGAHDD